MALQEVAQPEKQERKQGKTGLVHETMSLAEKKDLPDITPPWPPLVGVMSRQEGYQEKAAKRRKSLGCFPI